VALGTSCLWLALAAAHEPHRPAHDHVHAADPRVCDHLAGVWSRLVGHPPRPPAGTHIEFDKKGWRH